MIVWGGGEVDVGTNTGGVYDPLTNSWTPTSLIGAPGARYYHTAVWTGSKMIVWGGWGCGNPVRWCNGGGVYDSATDSWTETSTVNAPEGRQWHTAVWTGSRMIVWGGYGCGNPSDACASGGIYDPVADNWTATSMLDAPSARYYFTSVWTGSKMIVWGGFTSTGGIYDPATDTWAPTNTIGAPSTRFLHTAVWTGSRMIVWGGFFSSGGIYDPATDSWTATSTTRAPTPRAAHTAVWTGSKMIVWGGSNPEVECSDSGYCISGGIYNPATDSWTATSTTGAPSGRGGDTAVWTGSSMILWGGANAGGWIDAGAIFDLSGADPGDFDADGYTDILWQNQASGQLYAWLMNGTIASSGRSLVPPSVNPSWQVRGIGDLDGDHRSDLLWQNESTGQLYAWLMDGTAASDTRYLTPSSVNPVWQLQGLADFDHDGKADILWRNQATGQLYVWLMNGTTLSSGTYLSPVSGVDPVWQVRGLADLDLDGQTDILWHNQATGRLYAWFMSGITLARAGDLLAPYLSRSSVPDPTWQICRVADFDGNGLPDILWRNRASGALYVWVMTRYSLAGRVPTPAAVSDLSWQVVPR